VETFECSIRFFNNNHIYVTFCAVRFFQSVREAKNFEGGISIVNFKHIKGNVWKLVTILLRA
jgi:hypothetical protein